VSFVSSGAARRPPSTRLSLPIGQVAVACFLLAFSVPLISETTANAPVKTLLLLISVLVGGLFVCRSTWLSLNDPSLRVLGYFWLIKLGATLFLLYVAWIPQLDPASATMWGYDPQRYYLQAQELLANDWRPDFVSLNYVGILYYYAAIFFMFGENPVIPALINSLVTLVATVYIVRVGYEIKGARHPWDWTLSLALLLPEIVWFDVMTSRETLVAALLVVSLLTAGRYLAGTTALSSFRVLGVITLCALTIGAVRTSMLLPLIGGTGVMVVLVHPRGRSDLKRRTGLVLASFAIILAGPLIAGYVGGYNFDVAATLGTAVSAKDNVALTADVEWSTNSIGMLFMPQGILQALLFLPARMVLYLVTPLPKIGIPLFDLFRGSWGAWETLLALMSATLNVVAMPFVLASLGHTIKHRKANNAPLILHVSFWVTFVAIAGGNLIIHPRYRVMASLLLWGCAWLGALTCSRKVIARAAVVWFGLLATGGLAAVIYKYALT
jgi:hypothetical protein